MLNSPNYISNKHSIQTPQYPPIDKGVAALSIDELMSINAQMIEEVKAIFPFEMNDISQK